VTLLRRRKYHTVRTTDQSRHYLPYGITTPTWIVAHVYLGWVLAVGSPISRDRFAVAHIRLRLPLHAGLLWDNEKSLMDIG
jgi:hypothetical protein